MDTSANTTGPESQRAGSQIGDSLVDSLVDRWNEEHEELTRYVQETHRWLSDIVRRGSSGYDELAIRLQEFRDKLLDHFVREDEWGNQLQEACNWVETAATRRQITSDHRHLTKRIDGLIEKLTQGQPPYTGVEQAVDEVGLFVDAFELHEDQETQCLQSLTARPLDFRKLPR